jgi:hypothetical protein
VWEGVRDEALKTRILSPSSRQTSCNVLIAKRSAPPPMEFGQGSKEELLPEPREDIVLFSMGFHMSEILHALPLELLVRSVRSPHLELVAVQLEDKRFLLRRCCRRRRLASLPIEHLFFLILSWQRNLESEDGVSFRYDYKPRSQVSPKVTSFCREPAALLPPTDIQREIEIRK